MYHSAGGLGEGGTGPSQVKGNVLGLWGGRSKRLELEHTDVEALTDVSGTDASFAQACAAVEVHTCCFCVQYWCVYDVVLQCICKPV